VFNLGMGEITVILLLALIFLGPKKLPDLASGLGKIIRDIRKATSDVKNEIALDDTFRKPFEELRDAVTLHPDELKRRDEIKKSLEEAQRKLAEAEAAATATDLTPPPDSDPAAMNAALSETPPPPITLPPAPPPPVSSAAPRPSSVISSAPPPAPAPAVPTAPPAGTIARQPPPPRPRLGPPRVTPPVSMLATDQANKTQSLSEADLLPPPTPAPPTVPPLASGTKTPPPPPGMPRPPSGSFSVDKKKA
jgi:TatA/E family protein of Tat protein translocase